MTRDVAAIVAVTLSAVLICGGNAAGSDPIGVWTRQDGGTRIRIAPCGGNICAVNTWVRDPEGSEKIGDTLVMTLTQAAPTVFKGEAFDERRNRTYSMTMSFEPGGMKTRGCVAFGLLCKTAEWRRGQ